MYLKGRTDMNLNKREKILINIFINLFIIFTYHIYIYNPKINEINNLKSIKKQEEYDQSIEAMSKNEKILLKNLNQENIINIISDVFPESTTINSIKFQDTEYAEKYKLINIEIQVIGSMNDILQSIQKIDNSSISIYIKSIMLDSTKDYGLCTLYLRVYSL
jgi:Tfp pilus assembly protein PilO